jgi:hypothetical protein
MADNLLRRRYPGDLEEIQPRQTLDTGTPPVRDISARDPLRWLAGGLGGCLGGHRYPCSTVWL